MRKFIALLIVGMLCAVCVSGCSSTSGSSENESSDTSSETTQVENPMTEYASADELGQATGFFITVPASATDVTYASIAGDDNPIAQAEFTLGGADVTLRYKSTSSFEDISGMYYTWSNTKDFADSLGNTCTLNYNENEAASITSYYRVIGASCSVSMTGTDLHYDKIMSIYQQISDSSTIGDQTAM